MLIVKDLPERVPGQISREERVEIPGRGVIPGGAAPGFHS
jgi:hypothetical protein